MTLLDYLRMGAEAGLVLLGFLGVIAAAFLVGYLIIIAGASLAVVVLERRARRGARVDHYAQDEDA